MHGMETDYSLKYPYSYQERTPMFRDGVLFIPEFFTLKDLERHCEFQNEDWKKICAHPKLCIEYCSGNGQWICEMAKKNPDMLWIACEIRYDRVRKIYKRINIEKIPNCIIAFGAAETLTRYYLPNECLKSVYINFPDPWPKKRHAKHRLFQAPFLCDLHSCMVTKAEICLATDDMPYLEQALAELKGCGFIPAIDDPYYKPLDENHGYSFFEDLWTFKGKQNYQTNFYKT